MRFLHMADIHLGASPDAGFAWSAERSRELWDTFASSLEDAARSKTDLVLIAGDLFHRVPDEQQLREVDYLFSSWPDMYIALIAGNHDCAAPGSAWERFVWSENVAWLKGRTGGRTGERTGGRSGERAGERPGDRSDERSGAGRVHPGLPAPERVLFEDIGCEVYGFSYDRSEITENLYDSLHPVENGCFRILLAHGGDAQHIPISGEALASSGFDYVALGHIHRPMVLRENRVVYSGALSPIDAGDEGPHGYVIGETSGHTVSVRFVKKAPREYATLTLRTAPEDTLLSVRDRLGRAVREKGAENLYKVVLEGSRRPGQHFERKALEECGRILSLEDRTQVFLDLNELKARWGGTLIGRYIESFEGRALSETEQRALRCGLEALLAHTGES